jgi:PAS domain S-box-containing protein
MAARTARHYFTCPRIQPALSHEQLTASQRPDAGAAERGGARAGSAIRPYAEAVLAVAIATLLSWRFSEYLLATRLLLFWVSSLYVAWRGGLGPTLLASALGLLLANWTATPPLGVFSWPTSVELLSAVVYLGVTAVLGVTFDRLHRSRADALDTADRLREATDELQEQAAELEHQLEESQMLTEELETANEQLGELAAEARRAEIGRSRSEERYRALVEASAASVWIADPAGAVDDLPYWRERSGQNEEEVRGLGWFDAIHPADRDAVRARWAAAIASAQPFDAEFRLRLRAGGERWLHARAVPIRHGGAIVEWVGVFDDTHEAHVEAERRRIVANALAVLGSSLDYEWTLAALTRLMVPALADYCSVDLVDADGGIRRVSTAHVDPEKEEIVRAMWTRYPYRPTDRVGVPEVLRTGEPQVTVDIDPEATARFSRDAVHAALLAQLQPRSYACLPMSARGHVFGALSLVYSDSGRRYGEADVGAAREVAARAATAIDNALLYAAAQAANRAKSEFLATMSHELRTPLNAIAGYAELLAMGVRGPVNDDQLRDLTRIRQNQQHLLEIITDILNFSRLEAGRVHYALAPVSVRDVLDRMEGMIEPQARARSLEYRCENAADGLAVVADREKLEQVLINLLGNAVKFTPPGGRVTLGAEADDERVRINVRDTGIGIEPAQLGVIFEPFVQLEPALTRTAEGAGLGLAISRELARGMGGDLAATSTPGEGSVFTVELPRARPG